MARIVVIVCLLLLGGVIGWSSWGGTVPPQAPPADLQPVAPEPVVADVASVSLASSETIVLEREQVTAPDERDRLHIPDDAQWLEVTVVDGVTKEPVAGADVHWTNGPQVEIVMKLPVREHSAYFRDRDRIATDFGWHVRSDADGKVRMHVGEDGLQAFGYAGTRYGKRRFDVEGPVPEVGRRLELFEDQTLLVKVLAADGQPAVGVRTAFVQCHPDSDEPLPSYSGGKRTTDATGIARFRHMQERRRIARGGARRRNALRYAVAIAVPGFEANWRRVDAISLPTEPVELQLPPTGRLHLRATFEGRPIPGLIGMSFQKDRTAESSNESWSSYEDADGWTRFEHVPPGREFVLQGMPGGHNWGMRVAGPALAGQLLRTTVEISSDIVVCTGRVVLPDGQPLRERVLSLDFDARFVAGSAVITTRADGRFLWMLGKPRTRTDQLELKRLSVLLEGNGVAPMRTTVQPRELKVGRNDLGVLQLGVDEVLVAGRFVFDADGRDVWSEIEILRPSRPGYPTERWRSVRGLRLSVNKDHSFEARGASEPGSYRLVVRRGDILPVAPVEFVPGTKDLTIEIACGERLDATCRIPERIDPYRVIAMLYPSDAQLLRESDSQTGRARTRSRNMMRGQVRPSYGEHVHYVWPALQKGVYELRFESKAGGEAMLTIPDVHVPPPAGGDPRLDDIELSDVGTLALTVRLAEGSNLTRWGGPIVFFFPQSDEEEWRGIGVEVGETSLPVASGPLDLMVACAGFQPHSLRAVEGEAVVTLQPWPGVDLLFPYAAQLPEDVELLVTVGSGRRGSRGGSRYTISRRSGRLRTLMAASSTYQAVKDGKARIVVGDGTRSLSVIVMVGRRSKALEQVDPRDVAAGPSVVIAMSMEEILEVAEELREKARQKGQD